MERKLISKIISVDGMTCSSCEIRIEKKLKSLNGISSVKASFNESSVYITFDAALISLETIITEIKALDYRVIQPGQQIDELHEEVKKTNINFRAVNQFLGIGIILLALYLIIENTIGFNFIPEVSQNMGFGILFVVGLMTSIHCIAMCGGINLSQCMQYKTAGDEGGKFSKFKPSFLYNAGRVVSYTIIGGVVGALGSVVSFSGVLKGSIAIISGLFMVIMGLNMLNIFPWLRKLNPRMPKFFGHKIHGENKRGPFYVGLLNGLMPCGPLQAMQIYALGTGSIFAGAFSMFMFSLGTVPLMFGFGAVSSFLSGRFTHKMMRVSAMLVMVLGIIMVSRGLSLSGVNVYADTGKSGNVASIEDGVQVITTELDSGSYPSFIVQKGVPVKWNMRVERENLNGCNNRIFIPEYGIEQKLEVGDNIIEFTPEKEGTIPYTCWMGMINGRIKVVEDINNTSESIIEQVQSLNGSGGLGSSSGGCCGPIPPGYENGKIPTNEIGIAKVEDEKQEVSIIVDGYGYSPSVIVLQKGVEAKIKFDGVELNSCNSFVYFPEYQGGLDLRTAAETPWIILEGDFTFECGMSMLRGYVKVVDDINNIDIEKIKEEIGNYTAPARSGFGGGCH